MVKYLKAELVSLVETVDSYGQLVGIMLIGAEEWGDKAVPIIIGAAETLSIKKGLGEVEFPRPLTHDLFVDVLEALGAAVEKITIDALVSNTYTATVYVKDREGRMHTFDSRPSDAVAIAVRVNAPIYIADTLEKHAEDVRRYMAPPSGKVTEE
ncbi:MAG: bifunctional nuclease family protein [Pyrobaculum sp.]|nr:bifunctional nuclease family protein [Pyrobaculum sp.]MCC6067112.1 bifunctional nuclease family protein [Pyrobaculum sp.]